MSFVLSYRYKEALDFLKKEVSGIGKFTFTEHRPTATQSQMADFIVVSLPIRMRNQNAFMRTSARFELYARDLKNGLANTTRLQAMLDALTAKFPIVSDRFSCSKAYMVTQGQDGLGYTVWMVQAKMQINTTDSYEYAEQDTTNN